MDKKWWKNAVVYQVYPRSFHDSNGDGFGDLRGIIAKLDYLKDLGVDVLWLNPIYKSPNADNGYDISDYYDIMDEFGTMADFEDLLSEVHKRGMKLIMDLVVNHTSDEHKWFIESNSSKDNSYRDYYIWRPGKDGKEPNNWISAFSGSAWEYDETTDEYYLHVYAKKQPDLNWDNVQVRHEVYDMMKWWLNKGIDGFRMDVINVISKVADLPDDKGPVGNHRRKGSRYYINGPKVHDYLHEMNQEVLRYYDIMTVGETPKVDSYIAKYFVNEDRKELDMLIHFELMDLDFGDRGKYSLGEWKLTDIKKIMFNWYSSLKEKGWNANYFSNHDQPRALSRFGNDQGYRVESAKMLATLLLTFPGTPFIYQGEEIGMTNVAFDSIKDYNDIETRNLYEERLKEGQDLNSLMDIIHKKSRDNARTPMQWDYSENAGFTSGTPWLKLNPNYKNINVEQALADPNSIYTFYKELISLRKKHEVFVSGDCELLFEDDEHIFAYTRKYGEDHLLVVLNFYEEEQNITLPETVNIQSSRLLVSNYPLEDSIMDCIHLRSYEARVYMF